MRQRGLLFAIAMAVVAAASLHRVALAQKASPRTTADLSAAKPGRDPAQPIDADYTRRILEDTTEKFFLSPLVDYLPASTTVPTPKAVLGDIAGAKGNLPYSKQVYRVHASARQISSRARQGLQHRDDGGGPRDDCRRGGVGPDHRADRGEHATPREAWGPPHDQDGRRGGGEDRAGHRARLLHHGNDSLAGGGCAHRADGDGVSPRGGRQRVHPEHPRERPDAHHADRRGGRTRSHGRSVQLVEEESEPPGAAAAVLGQVRGARQQSRRDGRHLEADRERAEHGRGLARDRPARSPRIGAVPVRQHRAGRRVQRVDRSAADQRVAHDRLEQRAGNDADGHARRVCRRHVGQLVARLPVLPGRHAQRNLPAVRNLRQRRQRRYARADGHARPDVANVVPPESAAAAGDVVVAEQQQLHSDRPAGLVELCREQPPAAHRQLLREEQALDSKGPDRGTRGMGPARRRPKPRAPGGSARRPAEAARRDLARNRAVQGDRAQGPAARVSGRQLRHSDGSTFLAGGRCHARLPVLESGRDGHALRRHGLDVS